MASDPLQRQPEQLKHHRVVVIGGGVAGIAAAVRLAGLGAPVTLVETRKRLGGRATSFTDPATGETLDNCQHVVMRCCTNLLDLYRRLGVDGRIDWHKTLYFADGSGGVDTLAADDLPAPLHLMRSVMAFGMFDWREKLAIARGMLAVMQVSPRGRELHEAESFAEFLARLGQPENVVRRFWSVVIVSACNETLENVSAKYALQVFQEGFLSHAGAYEMGVSTAPLVELYDAAEPALQRAGGRLMLGSSAERFVFESGCVTELQLSDGRHVEGDSFISALPFDRLAKLCSSEMVKQDARLRPLDRFHVSPIVGIHLFFSAADGPVMDLPHLVLTDSPIQWVFNKGLVDAGASGLKLDGSAGGKLHHLHAVVSAAHELVDTPPGDLVALAAQELCRALPGVRDAHLAHGRAIKEKRATFSIRPGTDGLRPTTAGAIENLYLAGDWVRTGWPATMEGAARSGYRAAAAVLDRLDAHTEPMLMPDLGAGALYRFMAG